MTVQTYAPLTWDGTAVDGSGNIRSFFMDANSPISSARPVDAVEATVVTRGDRYVRSQPKGVFWELHAELTNKAETDVQALYQLFDESAAGLRYLRANDGDGKTWRVQATVTTVQRVTRGYYIAVLRVSDPTWEEDAQSVSTQAHMAGDSVAFTATNAGTRTARPQITITPNALKTDVVDDWRYSFRGFVVNPSANAFRGPVWLCDQLGVQTRIDTRTLVKDTTVSNQINQVGGIAAAALSISLDTPVGGGLRTDQGLCWIDTEQIMYSGIAGGVMTVIQRGVGGTTAATHSDNAVISKGEALANGDDLTVWLNGAQTNRYLVGWNSAATDVVANMALPPGRSVAIAATPLGTATSIAVPDASEFDDAGFAVLAIPLLSSYEVFYYAGKVGNTLTGCVRSLWGTTALAVSGFAATIYANPVQVVVGVGKGRATNPLSDASLRPCVQLPGSSNQTWKWGDEADDPSTCFFDLNNPDRSAGWTPGYDTDGNDKLTPLVALTNSATKLEFTDQDIGAGALPYNQAQIALPQGAAATGNIVADWHPVAEILNLELWGTDASGTAKLLDQLQQAAAAAGRAYALTTTFTALKLKGRFDTIGFKATAASAVATTTNSGGSASGTVAVAFTISKACAMKDLLLRVKLPTASGTNTGMGWTLTKDASGVPDNTSSGAIIGGDENLGTSTAAQIVSLGPFAPAVTLDPGKYWLQIRQDSGSGSEIQILGVTAPTSSKAGTASFAAAWSAGANLVAGVEVLTAYLSDGTAPVDGALIDYATGLRTSLAANFDKIVVPLGAFPIVHRVSGFLALLTTHQAGVLSDAETGDSIAVDLWTKPGVPLVIDADARTVQYTEDGVSCRAPGAIAPGNVADWLRLAPGLNHLTYAEPNMVDTTLAVAWRGRKV